MFVARWIIDAKFGHKDEVMALTKRWYQEVGDRAGMKPGNSRTLTGSIGAAESRFEFEAQFETLADLEKGWAEMAKIPGHKQFSKDLEQHVVSGSNRWEILRIIDM
ncbi:MAG TPA: hypothetical protein VGJ84_12880 [Polyangiaceae bacterium]|jgi:hypothetical protein